MTSLAERVSLFQGASDTRVLETVPLGAVLERIRSGMYRERISTLRQHKATPNQEAYRTAKQLLPAFTPCCCLSTRKRDVPWPEKLLSTTGMVHYDFDHVPEPAALKARLAKNQAVVFAFLSPGGDGVKVGVAATRITDIDTYKHAWYVVLKRLKRSFPDLTIAEDEHVKFLHSLCFVSDDPDLYVNPNAVPLAIPPAAPEPPAVAVAPEADSPDYATVTSALAAIPAYDAYDTWLKVGMALHSSGQPWARSLWDSWSSQSTKYDARAQEQKWRSFSREGKVHMGVLLTMAHEHGWRRPDPANDRTTHVNGLTSYNARENTPPADPHEIKGERFSSLTSLTSYPWPVLAPEAFYGLAGDYVHTIAPHSESDPAALLVQLLTVYGVVSGRNRYFQIEATRHYPNIFAVIAGLTSRARKGTSYSHIEAQMQTADPTWTLTNHVKGCGSGEGLIYAVRDPRMGREAIKEKGKIVGYQEVELDPGVNDKRALYQTGEFSSILKVCAREGNTLSEVIRDSWDTGYLRNATKGNPLTATEAHIGIIGHITIDEVRKLLSSTAMANGFGNRFVWICAKRSQELPEGGAIQSVNFHPLVARLRAAIAFGQRPGLMQRDAQASAAWKAVYGMLSDDRTGLANTLLARAEAQVVRLSMLYALLDQSDTIRHEHLNAALAVWQYAEDSAAYIFGEAIGDETADTILAALEQAGAKGCTRNYLLERVFQRNTPTSDVTRALHLLEAHGRITRRKRQPAGPKGRPAEVYALRLYEVNEVNQGRYLNASNDAVKLLGICSESGHENYEVNQPVPQSDPAHPALSAEGVEPAGCLHEHLHDAGHCNDCGELVSKATTLLEPTEVVQGGAESTEPTEVAAPVPRRKAPLSNTQKGVL